MTVRFNPFDPNFIDDPYPTYASLRNEDPVVRVRLGWKQSLGMLSVLGRMLRRQGLLRPVSAYRFLRMRALHRRDQPEPPVRPGPRSRLYGVARYEDVSRVLRTPEIFSSEIMGGSQTDIMNAQGDIAPTSGALIAHDPPEHTRQRNIVSRGFTPRRIAALEPRIRANAEELVDAFQANGQADLMAQFANPFPVRVIADLLGLDPSRREDFKRWSTALIVGSTRGDGGFGANVGLFREFRGYMAEVIDERRRTPGDDLISTLIHSGEDEGILSPEQVISFATLLLAAGSETTTNLIGNAMLALFRAPEQLERVRDDAKLIPKVVEEALRYDPPIQLTMRIATRNTEVAGVPIPRRSIVAALIGSANRDERVFADPERFDIDRADASSHLGFGFGNHFCIGASLARLEGAIALETLLSRLPGVRLASEQVDRHGSFLVRGPSALPLRFGR